ncbi:hypothetical protein EOM86_00645 [Candidatus Nomurabacteria bacterium]|nr:hypothetical protein [Candidatus Nomurabacteria bacterium]
MKADLNTEPKGFLLMLNKDISRGIGLGVFDGCHIGHAELILALVSKSAYLDLVPAVILSEIILLMLQVIRDVYLMVS